MSGSAKRLYRNPVFRFNSVDKFDDMVDEMQDY